MELKDYLKAIKDYELTDSEKDALAQSAEAFECATDKTSLELYYKLSMYASLIDGLNEEKNNNK